MKILIVEDEEALSSVLKERFMNEGYEVEVAADGEIVAATAKKFKPDLILLDLILPKKSGLEVLEGLKDDLTLKSIPVVILSNLAEDDSIKKGLALGALDYFVKTQHPIGEVVEKVDMYIRAPKVGQMKGVTKK